MQPVDYFTKEVEQLRGMYAENAKEIWDSERYCLLATGAIWSWSAAHPGDPGGRLLLWAPVLITGLFGLRAWGTYKKMTLIRTYLAELEREIALPNNLGWERRFSSEAARFRTTTAYAFWFLLFAIDVVVATVFRR